MKAPVLLARTHIQVAREILDKQMGLKLSACSLAGSLPLPHHHCRRLSSSLLPVPSHR
jgi:hypothetical protein